MALFINIATTCFMIIQSCTDILTWDQMEIPLTVFWLIQDKLVSLKDSMQGAITGSTIFPGQNLFTNRIRSET